MMLRPSSFCLCRLSPSLSDCKTLATKSPSMEARTKCTFGICKRLYSSIFDLAYSSTAAACLK
jgi:hypothetical protein